MSQSVFSTAGAPLVAAERSTYCPANRPEAVFQEKDGVYSVRLDGVYGTAGRWNFFYDLADDITACSCRLRHNGSRDAVKKALIPCWFSQHSATRLQACSTATCS